MFCHVAHDDIINVAARLSTGAMEDPVDHKDCRVRRLAWKTLKAVPIASSSEAGSPAATRDIKNGQMVATASTGGLLQDATVVKRCQDPLANPARHDPEDRRQQE